MKFILKILSKILSERSIYYINKLRLGYNMVNDEKGYLNETGYLKSKIQNTLLVNEEYVPWLNFSLIDILKEKLNQNLDIFEYGSGASTLFFSKRVRSVTSIEHDKDWFKKINKVISDKSNINLYYIDLDKNYPNSIKKIDPYKKYDIIFIDGRMRKECCISITENLKEGSVIILDDSDRAKYKDGIKYITDLGYNSLNLRGLKPMGFKIDQTTIFYKSGNNCLKI
ncbi:MAG: hypothetical protein CMD07_01180 [Flavobacteriales bacterium]|nr:hypothetical protein [Flavobacteriales bacterium]